MIRLHQYPAFRRLSSLSPFCIKVEAYLRMASLPFEIQVENNPLRGPRGRMPFIVEDQKIVSDSRLILEHLEAKSGAKLDEGLTAEEQSIAYAFHRMVDQDLYRVVLYSRWVDRSGWEVLAREFSGYFPRGLRTLALHGIRRSLLSEADGIGITEFSQEEVYALGERQLQAIARFLGEKSYFFGGRATTIDAALFGFLWVILETPIENPLREFLRAQPSLVAYCERIHARYFSEDASTQVELESARALRQRSSS